MPVMSKRSVNYINAYGTLPWFGNVPVWHSLFLVADYCPSLFSMANFSFAAPSSLVMTMLLPLLIPSDNSSSHISSSM